MLPVFESSTLDKCHTFSPRKQRLRRARFVYLHFSICICFSNRLSLSTFCLLSLLAFSQAHCFFSAVVPLSCHLHASAHSSPHIDKREQQQHHQLHKLRKRKKKKKEPSHRNTASEAFLFPLRTRPNTHTHTNCGRTTCSTHQSTHLRKGKTKRNKYPERQPNTRMFRFTWGLFGGSAARRKSGVATRSAAPVAITRQKTHAKPGQSRGLSKPVRRVSRASSLSSTRAGRCSTSPASAKRKAATADSVEKKKSDQRAAPEEASSSAPFTSVTAEEGRKYASARPAYMSAEREQEVLAMAERMQRRDLTTEVPVASFVYEILKAHPSVRNMGLRERMDFLLNRWYRLNKNKKLEYINDPLRGLL